MRQAPAVPDERRGLVKPGVDVEYLARVVALDAEIYVVVGLVEVHPPAAGRADDVCGDAAAVGKLYPVEAGIDTKNVGV